MSALEHPKIRHDSLGNLFLNFGEYGQEIELAAFSSDGAKLLTVQQVGTALIWNVASGLLTGQIKPSSPLEGTEKTAPVTGGFKVFIESAALSSNGTCALLGLNDGTAGIFSVETGERLSTFYPPDEKPAQDWRVIRAVGFSQDDSLAVVGFYNRSVGIWSVRDGSLIRFLNGQHADRLFSKPFVRDTMASSVAISQDNQYAFAGFADMTAAIWKLKSGECVFEAHQHVEKTIALCSRNETIRWATFGGSIYEIGDARPARKVLDTGESWEEVKFSGDGNQLLARTITGTIRKWSLSGENQWLAEAGNMFPNNADLLVWGKDANLMVFVEENLKVVIASAHGKATGETIKNCLRSRSRADTR